MIDPKIKAKVRLYYESHFDENKAVAAKFNLSYRTLMKWIEKEKWNKGYLVKGSLKKDIKKDLLKKELASRLDIESKKTSQNIKAQINNIKDFQALSLEEFNLEIEKISDELLSAALSTEFIHKNMIESFIYAKHELKRMSLLRNENKANPALIAMSEKLINMLANIQKSLYSKDILDQAMNANAEKVNIEKLGINELKNLVGEVIDID